MSDILVDSNILIDLFTRSEEWYGWSMTAFEECLNAHRLVINPIIYAEISVRFSHQEMLDEALHPAIEREALPWEAAFLAGKCFVLYRKRGGNRHSPMPDFFIGAHAAVRGMSLLTRDPERYRKYFPKLKLIAPNL